MVSFIHDGVSVHALPFRALSKIIRDFSLSNPRTFPPPSSFLIFRHILENPSFQIFSSFVSMKIHFSQIPLTLKTLLWLFPLQTLQRRSFFTVVCFLPVSLSWAGPLCGWSPQLSTRVLPSLMITHKCSFHSKWTAQLGEVEALQSQNFIMVPTFFLPKPDVSHLPSLLRVGWYFTRLINAISEMILKHVSFSPLALLCSHHVPAPWTCPQGPPAYVNLVPPNYSYGKGIWTTWTERFS